MLSRQLAEIFGQFGPTLAAKAHIGNIKRALVSNVAGQAVESRVREYLQNRMGIVVEIVKPVANTLGMTNGYAHPAQLGVDRWVAMIGARTYRLPQTMCVVDCGTAITIDFVTPDGQHLGGLITASEATIVSKVAQKTADIKEQGERHVELTPFAKSTEQALANGASYTVAGCIRAAVEKASEMLGTDVQIILTGGATDKVRSLLPRNVLSDEDLIMKGLVVLANN
jgi:type III pantothenate kinase